MDYQQCVHNGRRPRVTDPTQAKQVRLAGGKTARRYSWPPHPPHEFTVTSVTSAIKGGLPTPHLIGWAAKKTAECAVADLDIITAMVKKGDKRAAVNHLKGSRYRDMADKADRGTIVHAAVDAYLKGKPLSKAQVRERLTETQVPQHMWQSTAGMIAGAMEFLWDVEPEIIWNEATLYSRQHKYAGTVDLIARFRVGGAVHPAVVDFKTSRAIYDEVALQMVAYARADFVGLNDGTEAGLLGELPKKATAAQRKAALQEQQEGIRHGIVVRPKADGTYERADFTLSDEVFAMFLSCLGVTEGGDNDVLALARRPTVQ